jgi:hypothetical protein
MGSLRGRKETPLDVVWRYRSVVALVSVPVRRRVAAARGAAPHPLLLGRCC